MTDTNQTPKNENKKEYDFKIIWKFSEREIEK